MPVPSKLFRWGAPSSEYDTPYSLPPATEMRTPVFIEKAGEVAVCTARPDRVMSCVTWRAFNGNSTIRSLSTTVPTPVDRVSTSGASPVTCTSSAIALTPMVGFTTGLPFTCSTMPLCAKVANPWSSASSRYGPSGRFGNT